MLHPSIESFLDRQRTMSRAARLVEIVMQDRDGNVHRCLREIDSKRPRALRPNRKSIRLPQHAANETFAWRSSPRFLREQHRHAGLLAPKPESVFRLPRSIPLRSGSGALSIKARHSFADQSWA